MSVIIRVQNAVAHALGLALEERTTVVQSMLAPREGDGIGYWLQLLIATALATLGLALDSTAVVIGAMLIAPLMRPIVELAMGLATGSTTLVFRAGARAVASIVAVVGAAVVISWLLPFHEVTRELAARTAPSLLDLFVAAACALAGAYATIFSAREMATTAAGTSIGISLVPPLCTLGYGLSIGNWQMAGGAALLFTANIAGIIAVASVVFALVGFSQVVTERRLRRLSRFLLPVLLLAAIFVPLRKAVVVMTKRSELRQQVDRRLKESHLRIAQSQIDVDGRGAIVRVVIVGDAAAAKHLDSDLRALLARLGDATPRLSIWAVPDASALGALATRLDELPPPVVVTAPAPEPNLPPAPATLVEREAAVRAAWPTTGTGPPAAIRFEAGPAGAPLAIVVTHLGAPLGVAGCELLAHDLGSPGEPVVVRETALEPVMATASEALGFAARALPLLERTRGIAGLAVCVSVPALPKRGAEPAAIATVRALLLAALEGTTASTVTTSDAWSLVPVLGTCLAPPTAAAP